MNYNKIEAVRATELKKFISNPDAYAYELTQPAPILTPDALRIGTLIHAMYLEPDTVKDFFVYDGGISKITKAVAKKHIEAIGAREQEEWCLLSDMELATGVINSLPPLGKDAKNEITFIKEIEGIQCKCKVDSFAGSVGMDLKTCQDASPNKFKWAIRDFGYMYQMAFYSLVSGIDTWIIRAVEKTPPYIWHDYTIEPEDLQPYKDMLLGKYGYISAFKNWKDAGTPLQGYNMDRTTKMSELI